MALKVLGQVRPAATTYTALYTVPASKQASISSLTVCNTTATATAFRLRIAVAGAADADSQAIYHDISVPAYDTYTATIGITVTATDVVRVYAGAGNLSFSLFGNESAVS